MNVSRYHKFLRVSLIVTAATLVFDGGFINPVTKQLSDSTIMYMSAAGAGMYASVPENELNSLTAQISEQQRLLDAREAALREREIDARDYGGNTTDYSTYILSVILFILTALIVLNYIMDFVRVRNMRYEKSMG